MKKFLKLVMVGICLLGAGLISPLHAQGELEEFATSETFQWNVVSVARDGRIFVNGPRFQPDSLTVGELMPDGTVRPYPGGTWNEWHEGDPVAEGFVNTIAVWADRNRDALWVVDSGQFAVDPTTAPPGAKLVKIDLTTDTVERVYPMNETLTPAGSFLNDVRVGESHAYLSESGTGAVIVLDLETGEARRVLYELPEGKLTADLLPIIEGQRVQRSDGNLPPWNINPITLSHDEEWFYFQTTGGPNLLRIRTADLRDESLTEQELHARVETVAPSIGLGGMEIDAEGNIYMSDLNNNAVNVLNVDGTMEQLAQSEQLIFPDGPSISPDGFLYVPAAQINRLPVYHDGESQVVPPFRLFRLDITP